MKPGNTRPMLIYGGDPGRQTVPRWPVYVVLLAFILGTLGVVSSNRSGLQATVLAAAGVGMILTGIARARDPEWRARAMRGGAVSRFAARSIGPLALLPTSISARQDRLERFDIVVWLAGGVALGVMALLGVLS
jgi:sulfite exporter TauE/SafE